MRPLRGWKHAAYRWAYYLAMYSGLRALVNRARARPSALDPRLRQIDRTRAASAALGELLVRVHARPRPEASGARGAHGILSLRQSRPRVGRWTHRYFCATGHFGCGQVEIAFRERAGELTLYGTRNIAAANAHRLGFSALSERLCLSDAGEDVEAVRLAARLFGQLGFAVDHAAPDDCIRLAVDERLIAPARRARAFASLRRRYARLGAVLRADARARTLGCPSRDQPGEPASPRLHTRSTG
jgi:hypothetical protein